MTFRKKVYATLEELQQDLDEWLVEYNQQRTHSGKYCFGKTPDHTFRDSLHLAKVKLLGEARKENPVPLAGTVALPS